MATGWPMKTTYADGDVYAAQDVNDITGTINLLGSSVAYTAGKNKIINGDFGINQRAFTSRTDTGFTFDRFICSFTDGTSTCSAETFTLGTAPVAGYESTNYARLVSTGQTLNTAFTSISQKIESVRTFAGQTITISFWAKASTGTPSVAASAWQDFGTGGSATVQSGSKVAITSSWARYSVTLTLASIAGKTIAGGNDNVRIFLITSAGSTRDAYTGALGIQSVTIDFWGLQVEYGSTATAFQTATGTIQGELAACQRYYYRWTSTASLKQSASGYSISSTTATVTLQFPVTMRTSPSAVETTATAANYNLLNSSGGVVGCNAVPTFDASGNESWGLLAATVASGLTAGAGTQLRINTAAYIGWSAEL